MKKLNAIDAKALYDYKELIMDTNHYVYDGAASTNINADIEEEIYRFDDKTDVFEDMRDIIFDAVPNIYSGTWDAPIACDSFDDSEEIYMFD